MGVCVVFEGCLKRVFGRCVKVFDGGLVGVWWVFDGCFWSV